MSATSLNGHLSSGYGSDDGADDKPVVIVKKSGDGPGITALINRQLQGRPPEYFTSYNIKFTLPPSLRVLNLATVFLLRVEQAVVANWVFSGK